MSNPDNRAYSHTPSLLTLKGSISVHFLDGEIISGEFTTQDAFNIFLTVDDKPMMIPRHQIRFIKGQENQPIEIDTSQASFQASPLEADELITDVAPDNLKRAEDTAIRGIVGHSVTPAEDTPVKGIVGHSVAPAEDTPVKDIVGDSVAPAEDTPVKDIVRDSVPLAEDTPVKDIVRDSVPLAEDTPVKGIIRDSVAPAENTPIGAVAADDTLNLEVNKYPPPIQVDDDDDDGTVILYADSEHFEEEYDDDDGTLILAAINSEMQSSPPIPYLDDTDSTVLFDDQEVLEDDEDDEDDEDEKTVIVGELEESGISARLTCVAGPHVGDVLDLKSGIVTMGRSSDNVLVLSKDNEISRHHAIILQESGKFVVQDQNSLNGTFINDEPITGPRYLVHDDLILVGLSTLKYEEK